MSLILNGTTGISDVDGTAAAPALTGTDSNTGIFFPAADTIAFAEGGVEAVRIDSSGNVGIGTSSPSTYGKFAVVGTGNVIAGVVGDNTGEAQLVFSNATAGRVSVAGAVPLLFQTNSAERARINSSGDFLLNTTSFTGFGNCYRWSTAGIQLSRSADGDQIAFFTNGSFSGKISTAGSTTTYGTSSDYRLKEDITPMTGALARNALLNPVKYKWKIDGREGEGFIADQLQGPFPSAVTGEKDAVDADGNPVYQGIGTGPLDGHFAACVNELQAIIQEQQATITALTTRITALEAA